MVMTWWRMGAGLAVCIATSVGANSMAAQAPEDSIVGDTARLDRVVVTATRVPVRRSTVPATITVLDGATLRGRGIRTVAEALRDVPALAVVRTGSFGGATSLFLRGAESDHAKVLIDGVSVNSAGGAIDLAHLTLDNIDRIEIVRGPASVLYGSDAVAGVIQLFTRSGRGASRFELSAGGGNYDIVEADASLDGSRGALSYSGAVAHRRSGGIFPFNSDYRNTTSSAQLRTSPGGATSAGVVARYTDAELHVPTTGSGAVVDSNQVRLERRLVVGVDASRVLGKWLEAMALVGVAETDGVSDDQPDSPGDTAGFYSRVESDASRRTVEGRLNARLAPTTTLTAGSEFQWQREIADDRSQFMRFPPTRTVFDERRTNRGYYAQLLGEIRPGWSYSGGIRLDDNSEFGTFTTWRVGVAVPLVPSLRLRATAGTAFKEPAFIEQFNTSFSRGNPFLAPERSRSWEVAVEQVLAQGRIEWTATYFDQAFENLIQFIFVESPDSSNYFNIAAAHVRGAEVEARFRPISGLVAMLHYALVATKVTDPGFGAFGTFEDGQPLLRRPRHSAGATLALRYAEHGGVDATVRYVGARDDLDFSTFPARRVTLGGQTTLDLSADVVLVAGSRSTPRLSLTARVENVFDESYQPVAGFPAPGRTVLIGGRAVMGR